MSGKCITNMGKQIPKLLHFMGENFYFNSCQPA